MTDEVLLNDRYQIQSEIGRGGMGIVYRAYDRLLERDVAVKLLWSANLGSQGRARLLREAQAAARLNHPNIISIYDAGDSNGTSYIVMELLDGESLFDQKPDSLDGILEVVCQVCEALNHAHSHGIIHRDLKPENVIITSKGVAKLTDFGLSRSISTRVSMEGAIVGTVYYLAPEQALKKEVDGRADLYALGVMMYELVTGRLPFTADDPLAVITQHLQAPVVPPSTYNASLPPLLDSLIVRLLSKQPEDRPASAAEVKAELERYLANPDEQPEFDSCNTPLERLARGRLVGRKAEYEEIKALWRDITHNAIAGNVLVISGESGIGKTPLVKELTALANITGARILQGACYARNSAPYAPFSEALGDLHPLPVDLPQVALADVLLLSGELSSAYAAEYTLVPANPPLQPQAEQQRLTESMVVLLTRLAEHQPVLLAIEDIHWADAGTLNLLHNLARRSRLAGLPVLLVTTYRRSEMADNPALRSFLFDLHQERLMHVIDLEPFTRQQTRELLSTMFMEEISDDFLNEIYNVTEGNLFFIEEICKALIEEGRLSCEGGGWKFRGFGQMDLPQSVRMALQIRVARLPEQTQEVLGQAAVIGREFDFEVLRIASQMDEDTLIDALERAERAQLIVEARPKGRNGDSAGHVTFAFVHGLIPTTLRDEISALRRRRVHRRVAAAIEQLHPDDLEALAYHYTQAGDQDNARRYNRMAGDRASKYFANQEAINFYSEALILTPETTAERFQILAAREAMYDLMGRRNAQRADIDEMLDLAAELSDETLLCDAYLAEARYYLDTDYFQAREPIQNAVALARRINDPVREGRALRTMGWGGWVRGDFHESLSALETAVIRFRQSGLLADAAECLHTLSLVTGLQGLGELAISQKYAEDAVRLSRQASDRRQEAISLRRVAITNMDQLKYAEALPILQQALGLHRELGDLTEECSALNAIGVALGFLGRGDEARDYLYDSLRLAIQTGSALAISMAFENLQNLYFHREGDLEGGLTLVEEQLNNPEISTNTYLKNILYSRRADILATLGQYEAALEQYLDIHNQMGAHVPPAIQAKVHINLAHLYAQIGDFRRAAGALNEARELARRFERPAEAAVMLTSQAYLIWLEDDTERFEAASAQVEQAMNLLRDTGWHYQLAAALNMAARLALAVGKPELALERTSELMRLLASFPLIIEEFVYTHARALRACGRDRDANQHLDRVYQRVLSVAAKITTPAYRQSWVERAGENAHIVRDWKTYIRMEK